MNFGDVGPELGEDTNTETCLIVLFFRSFVTTSRKGYCMTISRRSSECELTMQLLVWAAQGTRGTPEVVGLRSRIIRITLDKWQVHLLL